VNKIEIENEIRKKEIILDFLLEKRDTLEIAEAIIRSGMEDECDDVSIPIIRNKLGMILEDR